MQKNDRKRENLFKKRREKFGSYECYVYFCTAFQQGAFGRTRAGPSLLEPRRAQPKVLKRMPRKVAGVIDRGGLEIRCTALLYRGFESLTFRKKRRETISRRFFCVCTQQKCRLSYIKVVNLQQFTFEVGSINSHR